MKKGQDIAVRFPGLYLVHHNLPGKKVSRHQHSEHLFFWPLQGDLRIHLAEKTLACGPGRMLYLPPQTSHAFESSDQQGERLVALLDSKNFKGINIRAAIYPASQLTKEILFYLLLHPQHPKPRPWVDRLIEVLEETLSSPSTVEGLEHLESRIRDSRLVPALQQLRSGIHKRLSMDEVAQASGLSLRNFNRLFLKEVGLTPKQLLTRYRIERARELLETGHSSVTQVAYEVGYESLSQFIRAFRELTGQLPSEYLHRSQ